MNYKPGILRNQSREIVNARNWAVGIITALLGLTLFVSEAKRIVGLPLDPLNIAYLCLLVVTGSLVFLWIWATQKELDLLFDWLDPKYYVPPSSIIETFIILFFGTLLTVLLLVAWDPFLYGVVFTVYAIVIIPTMKYTNKEIGLAIEHSFRRMDENGSDHAEAEKMRLYREGTGVLREYFVDRPTTLRHFLVLSMSIIGFGFATYWKLSGVSLWGMAAYITFFLVIVVSEIVMNRWRCVRDRRLREIQAELMEHLRSDKL